MLILAVTAYFSATASKFEQDGIFYVILSEEDKTVGVTFDVRILGHITYKGEVNIPTTVTYNDDTYTVVSIGQEAFSGQEVTKVIIPHSVTTIGASAFNGCASLTEVVIPNSVTSIGASAFHDCTNIGEVVISNSVTSIGSRAFYGCESITDIIIPSSVNEVGDYAFDQCKSLVKFANPSHISISPEYSEYDYDYGYWTTYRPVTISYPKDNIIDSEGIIYNASKTKIYYAPYRYSTDNLVLSEQITSVCDGAFAYSTIDSVTISKSVTTIGRNAFRGSNIKKITIQDAPTSIGDYAFKDCSLGEIDMGNSITTIGREVFNDENIINITIPNSVTFIGEYAFLRCRFSTFNYNAENAVCDGGLGIRHIDQLNIGEKVKCIHKNLFEGCDISNEVKIPKSVMSIAEFAFYLSIIPKVTIQDAPVNIADNAFKKCGLEEIDFGNSVTTIGDFAFSECNKLHTIRGSAITIGGCAFSECTSLVDVSMSSVVTICRGAFRGCSSLTEVIMPNSVTSIESNAFYGCSSLEEFVMPNSVITIGSSAFYGCSSLAEVVVPNSVTSIGSKAFYGCTTLKSATIGAAVSSIYSDAFKNTNITKAFWLNETPISGGIGAKFNFVPNDSYELPNQTVLKYIGDKFKVNDYQYVPLSSTNNICMLVDYMDSQGDTNISIPNEVTYKEREYDIIGITNAAFYGLSTLETISIPRNVRTIDNNAFKGCFGLKNLYSYAQEPPTCGEQTFDDAAKWDCNLFVPMGSLNKYQSADQWKDFFSIEEFDHNSDIDQVVSEKDNMIEVFNLSGLKVGTCFDGLAPGIYVVRSGGQTWKVRI